MKQLFITEKQKQWHSNTTLVKVKFYTFYDVITKASNSNTTLVKVKFSVATEIITPRTVFKYNTC